MANKIKSVSEVIEFIKDDMTVMIGGFMAVGTPEILIDAILEKGVKNLTIIANDTGLPDKGIGKLIVNKRVKKVIASHIGLNPETGRQMNNKELIVALVPQGTLAEQIRCGGAGIGGFLTETGVGTICEEGKQKLKVKDKEYLLELPLRADIALIGGSIADTQGNIFYKGSTRNFNPLMATAADLVIAGAERIVEAGELDPNHVMTPGIFVDYIVGGKN
ncbi:acetyl-CoA--acetoacetyl-CoA transferase subunit alpha [Clostridium beijerinckii]|uniref:Acetate CoA-transferase subunit alpha n=1 Tax=Clostridium beijerinckii TaxID=1520 RepID=A0AB74VA05_CLOBE|nr:acetate CoA-transferase subunit alpha [Clostridium beijerinckii]NRZ27436.1 acetate CoA/acetoacetate CoA-transferase alpha subunit [Clostridium beijerinckii]NYB96774.1 acetate CoA/acetoacetate CoA-transferase alpha subunit [Clostridium beijerinckii]OOM22588.1 acetate CoA-transferase subunit alpha [Clostridium beijerinckii]QUN33271.1 acetate CoA-transferase subunit alpha [Clostridium beijerinckii]SQB19916.1 acetate CoA-transferase subunit alpha [Clostridium beijerinckii]